MATILVTGGAGFIGGNLARMLVKDQRDTVVNVDKLTYAGNKESLADLEGDSRHIFVNGSINDRALISGLLEQYRPAAILHLAAESHVDRSISGPGEFIATNIVGTFELLEATRQYCRTLSEADLQLFRLVHVSTDEVYGSLGADGYFTETSPYAPSSPYSASKAAADHLVRAYHHTYGMPTIVTNCSNNYGPYQFPEKLIPLMVQKALAKEPLPVYGDGRNVRDWLFVTDHCAALSKIMEQGKAGETYNIGGNSEEPNINIVKGICDLLDELSPRADSVSYRQQITFVKDRPGHDRRYAIDAAKLKRELGWQPRETLITGLRKTVEWYLANQSWCQRVLDGSYRGQRLGLLEMEDVS